MYLLEQILFYKENLNTASLTYAVEFIDNPCDEGLVIPSSLDTVVILDPDTAQDIDLSGFSNQDCEFSLTLEERLGTDPLAYTYAAVTDAEFTLS